MKQFKTPEGKVVKVADEHVDAAKEEGLVQMFEMTTPDKKKVLVAEDHLEEAEKEGLLLLEKKPVTKMESVLRGAAQGASFGFADELTGAGEALGAAVSGKPILQTYSQARDESRKNYKNAEDANPMSYLAGEVGGGIASSFVPGGAVLNAAKGAKLATVVGMGALGGAFQGLGSSDADTKLGDLKNIAIGAGVGGALSAVLPVAKALIPGVGLIKNATGVGEKAANFVQGKVNSGTSALSANLPFGIEKAEGKIYKELLDNPAKYQEAIDAGENIIQDIAKHKETASDLVSTLKGEVSDAYKDMQNAGLYHQNMETVKVSTGTIKEGINEVLEDIRAYPTFYDNKTKTTLKNISGIIDGKDPGTALRLRQIGAKLASSPNEAGQAISAANNRLNLLERSRLLRARREADAQIDWTTASGLNRDTKALQEIRGNINTAIKDADASGYIKKADEMYSAFKNDAESYLDQLTHRGGDEVSTKKLVNVAKDAGSDATRSEREGLRQSLDTFLEGHPEANTPAVKDAIDKFNLLMEPLKVSQELRRIQAQTGHSTGRSLVSLALPSTMGVLGTGAMPALITGALATPLINPAGYLKTVAFARNIVSTIGEVKAAKWFGEKGWPIVQQALAKEASRVSVEGE